MASKKEYEYCQCMRAKKKKFKKEEIITSFLVKRSQLCVLVDGVADLIRYDKKGNKTIVERYTKDDIFGELFYNVSTNSELNVVAMKDCTVIFFDVEDLYAPCNEKCSYHTTLHQDLLQRIIKKTQMQNTRIELLSKRSIRDKLLSYFQFVGGTYNKTFTIPFSYTDLADYMNVERSALMRELKNLSEDGFIKRDGSKITLLY